MMVTIFIKIFQILLPTLRKLGRELPVMVRQLGNPTIFISLSSADTSWVPLQQALGLLLDEVIYSENFIKEEMSFEKKCQQVFFTSCCL